MRTPRVVVSSAVTRARLQLAGFESHPDLAEGLPFAPSEVRAGLDDFAAVNAQREHLRQALAVLTEHLREKAYVLRERVQRNLRAAEGRLGRYAPELALIGGKPFKGSHRSPGKEKGRPEESRPLHP